MANDAYKAIALTEAAKLGGSPAEIVARAKVFMTFFTADEAPPAGQSAQPGAEPPKPTPAPKPAPAAKPAAKAPAAPKTQVLPKLASAPETPAEPETAPEGETAIDWSGEPGKKAVGDVVAKLIAANKRPDAAALLKEYDATSVSAVKPGEREAFVAEATELLNAADITA